MSIRIEITDPASLSIAELHALSNMLLDLVDNKLEPIATGLDALRIAAEDSPAAGAPFPAINHVFVTGAKDAIPVGQADRRFHVTDDLAAAAAAFGTHRDISRTVHPDGSVSTISVGLPPDVDPSAVFGDHGSPALDADAAKLNAMFGPGSAGPTLNDIGVPPVPNVPPASGPAVAQVLVPPTGGVQLDVKGLPWDARIHSSGRAKIADGTWKMKRGTIPEVVARVEAELRQVMAIPSAAPVAPVWPFSPPVPNVPPAPTDSTVPAAPPAPSPVAIVTDPATASPSSMTFPDLVKKITSSKVAGTLTDEMIKIGLAAIGVPALPLLATRQDLIGKFASILDSSMAGA